MKNKKTLFAVGAGIVTGIGALVGIKKAIDKKNTEEILYSEADLETCGCGCEEEIFEDETCGCGCSDENEVSQDGCCGGTCCGDEDEACGCGCDCSEEIEPTENVHTEDTCCGDESCVCGEEKTDK